MYFSTSTLVVVAAVALAQSSVHAAGQRQTAAEVLMAKRIPQPQPNSAGPLDPSSSAFSRKAKRTSHLKPAKAKRACKAKTVKGAYVAPSQSGSSSAASPSSSKSASTATNSTSSSSTSKSSSSSSLGVSWDSLNGYLTTGNLVFGFLPDDGSGGGKAESLSQINAMMPGKSVFYGRYAQASSGKTFDGSQLYQVLDDVKKTGSILAASVMPAGSWYGFTKSDNHQAVAIAKVCKDIQENHGIEVWLRFAHEMNWYQQDGTYAGGVSNFQEAWAVVAAAVDQYSPNTKLWWSPNVGSDADYAKYYPTSGRVDVVGFDWYPTSASQSFLGQAKSFHDKYAVNGRIMVQGETGLHYSGSIDERLSWIKQITSKDIQQQMPNYVGAMLFNYYKFENGKYVDFRIVDTSNSNAAVNAATKAYFSSWMKS